MIQPLAELTAELQKMPFLLYEIKCAPIKACFFDILILLLKQGNVYFKEYIDYAQSQLQSLPEQETFRISHDLGDSVLRKRMLSYLLSIKFYFLSF
jgi:hypothetical protein